MKHTFEEWTRQFKNECILSKDFDIYFELKETNKINLQKLQKIVMNKTSIYQDIDLRKKFKIWFQRKRN